jgi:hypothetical protein
VEIGQECGPDGYVLPYCWTAMANNRSSLIDPWTVIGSWTVFAHWRELERWPLIDCWTPIYDGGRLLLLIFGIIGRLSIVGRWLIVGGRFMISGWRLLIVGRQCMQNGRLWILGQWMMNV